MVSPHKSGSSCYGLITVSPRLDDATSRHDYFGFAPDDPTSDSYVLSVFLAATPNGFISNATRTA